MKFLGKIDEKANENKMKGLGTEQLVEMEILLFYYSELCICLIV